MCLLLTLLHCAGILDAPFDPPREYTTTTASKSLTSGSSSSGGDESFLVNESWVLPVLIKYGGEPVVSESGNIFYKFDEFIAPPLLPTEPNVKAYSQSLSTRHAVVQEQKIPFSIAASSDLTMAKVLGGVNVLGVGWLGSFLRDPLSMVRSAELVTVLSKVRRLVAQGPYDFYGQLWV